jgi:peptidyl-prolyl cis-trans isomerase SurA
LELKENLRQVKFNQAVIRPRISVDDTELQDAYLRRVDAGNLPRIYDIGAFFIGIPQGADEAAMIDVLARAEVAVEQVRTSGDFAAVASEVDEGPYGAQGGRMGTYREGELLPELDAVADTLQVGETSAPIGTPQGFFVLHMFGMEREEAASYEELKDALFEQVYSESIEAETDQWYRQARRRAAVLIKLELPEPQ